MPRAYAQQVPDKKVLTPADQIRPLADTVLTTRDNDQIEILISPDQRIHHLHRRCGVHVGIQLTDS